MRKYHCIFSRQICALQTGNRSDQQAELSWAAAQRDTKVSLAWAARWENGDGSGKREVPGAAGSAHVSPDLLHYRFALVVSMLLSFWKSEV